MERNPLESPPVDGQDVHIVGECLCFGGPVEPGCASCKRRRKTVNVHQKDGVPVVDAAQGEAMCDSCGTIFETREGTGHAGRGQCADCHGL